MRVAEEKVAPLVPTSPEDGNTQPQGREAQLASLLAMRGRNADLAESSQ